VSILASELVGYNAASQPVDDTSTSGGAIAPKSRTLFTQFTAAAVLTFQSDNAGDTGNVVITGRDTTGRIASETLALDGVSETPSVHTYLRIHSVLMAADAIGTITVRQGLAGSTVTTIPPGERGFAALFQRSVSDLTQQVRYEKLFFKNATISGLSLFAAAVTLAADATGDYAIGLAAAVDDTVSVANRMTAPSGISFVGLNDALPVPGGALDAGHAIGVWVRQTLAANEAAHSARVTAILSGQTI